MAETTAPQAGPAPRQRLYGIEACRGVAATMVVCYHVARHLDQAAPVPVLRAALQFGHAGVDLFFVLSGFIILFVHRRDIGRPDRLRHYLGRRVTRLMPTYWVALLLMVVVLGFSHAGLPSASQILWSLAPLPGRQSPLVVGGWTLQFETLFYGLFAILILNRRLGLLVMAAWAALTAQSMLGGWMDRPFARIWQLTQMYDVEFFIGMGVALALLRGRVPGARAVLWVGLLGFAVSALAEDLGRLNGYGAAARFAYGLPAGLILMGIAELDRQGRLHVSLPLRWLGAGSYSIYLFQFIFIAVIWHALVLLGLDAALPTPVLFAVLAGGAVIGGMLMSERVEKPLIRMVRSLGPRRAVAAS